MKDISMARQKVSLVPQVPVHISEKRGLECISCGCRQFRVLYTRSLPGGRIIRRRECRYCGKRITTCEMATKP